MTAVLAVVVECPFREQEGCSLAAFGEALGAGDTERENAGRLNRVVEFIDRFQSELDTVEVIRLVEPLVIASDPLVDGDGKPNLASSMLAQILKECFYSSRAASSQATSAALMSWSVAKSRASDVVRGYLSATTESRVSAFDLASDHE